MLGGDLGLELGVALVEGGDLGVEAGEDVGARGGVRLGVLQEREGGAGGEVVDVGVDLLDVEEHARERRGEVERGVGRVVGCEDERVRERRRFEGRVEEGFVVDVRGFRVGCVAAVVPGGAGPGGGWGAHCSASVGLSRGTALCVCVCVVECRACQDSHAKAEARSSGREPWRASCRLAFAEYPAEKWRPVAGTEHLMPHGYLRAADANGEREPATHSRPQACDLTTTSKRDEKGRLRTRHEAKRFISFVATIDNTAGNGHASCWSRFLREFKLIEAMVNDILKIGVGSHDMLSTQQIPLVRIAILTGW